MPGPTPIINEQFKIYSPGQFMPNHFHNIGIVFNSQIIDTSEITPPSPAVGFYERTGNIYNLFGTIATPENSNLDQQIFNSTVNLWTLSSGIGVPCTVQFNSTDPSTFQAQPLLSTRWELDGSFTAIVPGGNFVNTLVPNFQYNTWLYVQVTVGFSVDKISVAHPLGIVVCIVSIAIQGQVLVSEHILDSDVDVGSLWDQGADMNQWYIIGPANGQYLAEIAIYNASTAVPIFPNPDSSPIKMHMSQVAGEYANTIHPQLRLSQLPVEIAKANVFSMRMSQIIVEIAKASGGGPSVGQGFVVKES